jgi:hypothetical protein
MAFLLEIDDSFMEILGVPDPSLASAIMGFSLVLHALV